MNASLDKEQIEYIQSIVGKTDYEYQKDEDEYSNEEWDQLDFDYEEMSKESDEYWYDLVLESGDLISDRNEDKHRHYTIYNSILKVGDRYFELMNWDTHNEQMEFSDMVDHYGLWSYDVTEVYPKEVITIDYSYKK